MLAVALVVHWRLVNHMYSSQVDRLVSCVIAASRLAVASSAPWLTSPLVNRYQFSNTESLYFR